MPFLDGLFGPHLNNLQNALGKSTERQALLANNIANINTPGYKRQDADFSIVLEEQLGSGMNGSTGFQKMQQQRAQRESNHTSLRADGNNVDLEHEVYSMAETELRFQALSDMTSNYFQSLKNAIREGR